MLGYSPGSTGDYSLTGGTLSTQHETIGYQGTGSFTQSGGNHIVTGFLELGYMYSGVGTYTLEGGSLSADQERIGGDLGSSGPAASSFVQRLGANTVSGKLVIGLGTDNGSYSLADDGDPTHSTLTAGSEYVGTDIATGSFSQYGGINTITPGMNADGSPHGLYIAFDKSTPLGYGTYVLTNGMLQSPYEAIGYGDPGTFIQTSGTNSVTGTPGSPSLLVGNYGTGLYILTGGTLSVAGAEVIGLYEYGTGSFTQYGGTHTVSSGLSLGANPLANGGYSLAGGSLFVAGDESIGASGIGTFVQSGGTHVSGGISLGLNSSGIGTYSLASGTLSVAGDELIGLDGSGTFSQSGGSHLTNGTVYIAQNSGGHGTYSLSGGSLAAVQVSVGQGGAGSFMQSGGMASISGSAYVGGSQTAGGGTGTLAISGGTMSVGHTLKVWNTPGTSATLSGGTLSVGALDLSGDPSLLTWSAGTLNFSTNTTIDSSFALGPAITLSRGMRLFSSSLLTNNGHVTLLDGELASTGPIVNGTGQITGHGTITAYDGLANNSEINLGGGAVAFTGQVTNNAGGRIDLTNATTTFERVTNNAGGTFKISGGSASFFGLFTNNGAYSSDPADNYFTDLQISTTGVLTGGPSDRFFISRSLFSASTQNTAWNTASSLIDFHGGAIHSFSITGIDLGADPRGYINKFAVGTLELDSRGLLFLEPATSNAALYVEALKLDDGIKQTGSIHGNGADIYYDPANPANAYLGDQTYALGGGGEIAPVPEPAMLPLLLLGAGLLARRPRRSPRPV